MSLMSVELHPGQPQFWMATAVLVFAFALSACALRPAVSVRSWLDPKTAVSVTAQDEPIVFAREDFQAGINVRDYAEVGAVEINKSGDRRLYLAVAVWGTIDRSAVDLARTAAYFAQLTVWCDDRPIELHRAAAGHEAVNLSSKVLAPPVAQAPEFYYPVNIEQLHALTRARALTLSVRDDGGEARIYRIWQDRRRKLAKFVEEIAGVRGNSTVVQ